MWALVDAYLQVTRLDGISRCERLCTKGHSWTRLFWGWIWGSSILRSFALSQNSQWGYVRECGPCKTQDHLNIKMELFCIKLWHCSVTSFFFMIIIISNEFNSLVLFLITFEWFFFSSSGKEHYLTKKDAFIYVYKVRLHMVSYYSNPFW